MSKRLFYSSYQVLKTEVIVGCRPELVDGELPVKADAWISVTEKFLPELFGKAPIQLWFPWVERVGSKIPHECMWGVLKTLNYLVDQQQVGRVYLHCDAGTHRAPTLFGAYLLAFHKDEAQAIVDAVQLVERDQKSDPLYYIGTYLGTLQGADPENQKLIDWIGSGVSNTLSGYYPNWWDSDEWKSRPTEGESNG
jgi:hypothetical protein